MKKNLAKKVTLSILAGTVLMSSSVVWAADTVTTPPPGADWTSVISYLYHANGKEIVLSTGTDKSITSAYSDNGDATGGKVTISISDGMFGSANKSVSIYGGFTSTGEATGNAVTIIDGTFTGDIYGGYSNLGAAATDNSVVISGGMFKPGNNSNIYGGRAVNDATRNSVTISGGTFGEEKTLGQKSIVYIAGGYSYKGNAKGNTVSISDDANLAYANLYGGLGVDANDNTVAKYGDASNPNTLNIGTAGNDAGTGWAPTNGRTISSIKGFDVINIYGVEWDETKPYMTATDVELKNTKINAYVSGEQSGVNSKKMILIDATNLTKASVDTNYLHSNSNVTLYKGIADVYTGVVEVDETNKDVVIKLEEKSNSTPGGTTPEPERNDQVLVLGESRTAAVAFTNQGSELIETGLNALVRDNEKDTKVFAAVYGNHSEYETGSHVNVNGWSGIVGIGKTNANGLTVGAFFENGEGNYSTHNIFTNDYIRGDGEACYNGGGFLVRKDNANGVYAEASLRAGNLQNELRNAVRNGSELTGYDIDTFYYGAHVGIGKVIPRGNDGDSLDVYGKFIYTHHDGETFDIGGTATKFDSVESERLRLGFRINEVQTNKLSMYYGAAWEYEFNGDAHDKIASFDLETPSLEGSTVIGEIGAHYKASEKWSFDLNGRAYVGQREGFSSSVQANYAF